MPILQVILLVAFLVALLVTYAPELLKFIKPAQAGGGPTTNDTDAVYTVKDLITVAELRDRLATAGCAEGAETCKTLIRVMIEFKRP